MGKKAYQERLKQIRMDPVNADVYQQFSSSVQKQVSFETFFMTLIKFTKFFFLGGGDILQFMFKI